MGQLAAQLNEISIHALLAESDRPPGNSCGTIYLHFYPRSPCGERRMMKLFSQLSTDISIHALLAESDLLPFAMTITALDFYPRSPCGERPKRYLPCCTSRIFLSTLSLRRATGSNPVSKIKAGISIHALLAESDTPAGKVRPWASHISIHALLAESD